LRRGASGLECERAGKIRQVRGSGAVPSNTGGEVREGRHRDWEEVVVCAFAASEDGPQRHLQNRARRTVPHVQKVLEVAPRRPVPVRACVSANSGIRRKEDDCQHRSAAWLDLDHVPGCARHTI
jgi:hypothetical protein